MQCEMIRFDAADVIPAREPVMASQGIPSGVAIPERITRIADTAFQCYSELVGPIAMLREITPEVFSEVLVGEGHNDPEAPIASVAGDAERLALFAVTLGQPLCDEIRRLFAVNEPALGCMLDGVASAAADLLATRVAEHWAHALSGGGNRTPVLPYSPGYCGWHITGQRRLFQVLQPEEIGVALTPSCLMQPLKSVSGVLAAAAAAIHERALGPSFAFCTDCTSQTCRDRVDSVLALGG